MTTASIPRIAKWPFFIGDGLLLGVAWWIMARNPHPLDLWLQVLMSTSVLAACWLGVWPFLEEYRAAVKVAESESLTEVVAQLDHLDRVAEQIGHATAQWQTVQEQAGRTVTAANDLADRITGEAKEFAEFMQKANDTEKAHLRLTVEKMHRTEAEWLQAAVNLLDHIYALHKAADRSGQPNLIHQLTQFQSACRDVVRRMGLVPIEAQPDQSFDPKLHQLPDGEPIPATDARITECIATGFTYQAQLVRPCLVRVNSEGTPTSSSGTESVDDEPTPAPAEGGQLLLDGQGS